MELVAIVKDLLTPATGVERTMVMPFDLTHRENVAEHSFILGTLACSLAPRIDPGLDLGKVAQLALAHDLVEVYAGDTTVWAPENELQQKAKKERVALERIEHDYTEFGWLGQTIREYEVLQSAESRYVYALDKIVPHIMIVAGNYHPVRPTREAYQRTETRAREKISAYPKLLPLFDELCEVFERSPHFFSD